jgi:hypothetical protein
VPKLPATALCYCCVISGYRCEVDENRALLGFYAASSVNFLRTFRDQSALSSCSKNLIFESLNPEDGTDRLSRNKKQITTTRCVLTQKSAVLVRVTVKSRLLVVLGISYLLSRFVGRKKWAIYVLDLLSMFLFPHIIPVARFYH